MNHLKIVVRVIESNIALQIVKILLHIHINDCYFPMNNTKNIKVFNQKYLDLPPNYSHRLTCEIF